MNTRIILNQILMLAASSLKHFQMQPKAITLAILFTAPVTLDQYKYINSTLKLKITLCIKDNS